MSTEIDHDLSNMFILFNHYADECQAWIRNPDTEMLRVIKKLGSIMVLEVKIPQKFSKS
jgi:hypothetical protein